MLFKSNSNSGSMISSSLTVGLGIVMGVALCSIVKNRYKYIDEALDTHHKNKFYKIMKDCREEYARDPEPPHNLVNDDTILTEPICSSIK